MRIAIAHDYLNQMGGAEKVLEVFHEMFPSAPIYTSVFVPSAVSPKLRNADIRTSFMQKMPFIRRFPRHYLAAYPYAFELFNFTGYDVVLSSSSAFAKGVITGPDTCHICYCHTPMRFAWSYYSYIERERLPSPVRLVLPYVVHRVRRWDEITSGRVDHFVSNSHEVERRIRKYYRRSSTIIHPPVEADRFRVTRSDEGYYVLISRLLGYKRVDIAVEAANRMRLPLRVVGTGRDEKRLRKLAGPTVQFTGRLSDEEIASCLQNCRALLFPGREDFGIVPVEAMACGKPVIAYGKGGALDSVIDGLTGVIFREQTAESLMDAIGAFRPEQFDPDEIRRHAEKFDVSVFRERIREFIGEKLDQHTGQFRRPEERELEDGLASIGLSRDAEVVVREP